jgi:hypothetical protein
MHPLDCPNWEYDGHPQRAVVRLRIADILSDLASGRTDTLALATDARPQHLRIFSELVPLECNYYAGHYRGEAFHCLRSYLVGVQGDHRVGAPPGAVGFLMAELKSAVRSNVLALDDNVFLSEKDKLRYIVMLACRVFVHFLTIHPYVNGNGHIGRLVVWSIMGRYGYWPRRWPIDPRPANPPYLQLIVRYRNGEREPLEMYMLQMLAA